MAEAKYGEIRERKGTEKGGEVGEVGEVLEKRGGDPGECSVRSWELRVGSWEYILASGKNKGQRKGKGYARYEEVLAPYSILRTH
jgi:hypothetical protein